MPQGTVSIPTLEGCRLSAEFWAGHIGSFADKMQSRADQFAIAAALLSTITGLSAWGSIAASAALWAQLVVGFMAIAAAVASIVPKVRKYAECAFKAAPLASEYGRSLGELQDAIEAIKSQAPNAQAQAAQALKAFYDTKKKKDTLVPFPRELEELVHTRAPMPASASAMPPIP